MIACPNCGTEMVENISGSSLTLVCPACKAEIARSWTESINEDETLYSLALCEGNEATCEILSAISQVANANFIEAKKLIGSNEAVLVTGLARDIKGSLELLENAGAKTRILPNWPY